MWRYRGRFQFRIFVEELEFVYLQPRQGVSFIIVNAQQMNCLEKDIVP